ncbi:MAG: hypothetical protein LBQ36_07510 [Synergistaceae bacterium]|jgi:DNA polymerase-3 subunit delta'|nr:hypothetical protein [Synergistaceae bacterium]
MPDIAPALTKAADISEWAALAGVIASGGAPQALLAVAGEGAASSFKDAYARLVLCDSGTGEDGCPSCGAWSQGWHPDLVIAGDGASPPGVADCIALQASMNLKPFVARRRLAVIPFAEAISLPAANSLLKLAEEPPEGALLLFVAASDNLIPTIRSRAWAISLPAPDAPDAAPPPASPSEWAGWMGSAKKKSIDEISAEADAWSRHLASEGEWRMAASVRNAVYLSKKRHMPVSMVQDALFAILREGVPIGQIFGDLR